MDPLEGFVEQSRNDPRIRVEGQGDPVWKLHMNVPPGCSSRIEILDGREYGKWWVVIQDSAGVEVWSDWAEYSDDGPVHLVDVRPEMVADLREFIDLLTEVEAFRITTRPFVRLFGLSFFQRESVEWLHRGAWKSLDVGGVF